MSKSAFLILTTEAWYNTVLQQMPSQVQEVVMKKSEKIRKFGQDMVEISDDNDSYYNEEEDLSFSEFEEMLYGNFEEVFIKTFDFE